MGLWRLSSPPSLPEAGPPRPGSSGLCPAGLWAAKDRNSTHTLGNLCQCLTSFTITEKRFFFYLSGNSIFLLVASYPITGHRWQKCVSAFPWAGIYTHSSQCAYHLHPQGLSHKAAFHPLRPQSVLVHWVSPPQCRAWQFLCWTLQGSCWLIVVFSCMTTQKHYFCLCIFATSLKSDRNTCHEIWIWNFISYYLFWKN